MSLCVLVDRAIVAVAGEEAEGLLNRLVTNSVLGMESGEARYAALLSPQGKIQFDFQVLKHPGGFWLDCRADQATDLAKKLAMFRLRAKVTIEQSDLVVVAAIGEPALSGTAYRDPRHGDLGLRTVVAPDHRPEFAGSADDYEARRVALGVPAGGVDFIYGDSFVHDANLDLLHGIDFGKGCYVGQEVVSRVHHRDSVRKRVVKLRFLGDPPTIGAALTAGPLQIGVLTSLAGQDGLATARLDRLAEAEASHAPVLAGETMVEVTLPTASPTPTQHPAVDDA